MNRVAVLVLWLASSAAPLLAEPATVVKGGESAAIMRVFGHAYPPFGFVQFCARMPAECEPGPARDSRLDATPARLSDLDQVNRAVNEAIAPATDLELYGVNEHWTLPRDKGDCEDYALLKRHILMRRGWPASALLITVVRDERGEGHAILTARTAQGDYILDNRRPDVRLWHRTGYRFVMRQSYIDPRLWVSLDPDEVVRPVPLTGMPLPR